jgi:hypothetical protein
VNIAFYAAEQDKDHDGFPTRYADLRVHGKLARPAGCCEPSDSYVACLEPCWNCDTEGSGRAIFKLTDSDRKMFFVLKVKDVTDATYARIHISETPGEIGAAAVSLFPLPPQTGPRPGTFTGMLSSCTFSATDFIGPLKGKTMQDLVEAIADTARCYRHRVGVAEICGAIEP